MKQQHPHTDKRQQQQIFRLQQQPLIAQYVLEAYQLWTQRLRDPDSIENPQLIPLHVCTPACFNFQHHCVYICSNTGNMHICTVDLCDSIVETREYAVCRVTLAEYPLFIVSSTADREVVEMGSRVSTIERIPCNRGPRQQAQFQSRHVEPLSHDVRALIDLLFKMEVDHSAPRMRDLNQDTVSSQPEEDKAEFKDEAAKSTTRRGRKRHASQMRSSIVIQKRRYRRPDKNQLNKSVLDEKFYERMATACITTWHKIMTTKCGQEQRTRYRFMYHALVILYLAQEGFQCSAFSVPKEPLLVHLPPRGKLSSPLNPKTYTATSTVFMECVDQLEASNKLAITNLSNDPSSALAFSPVTSGTPRLTTPGLLNQEKKENTLVPMTDSPVKYQPWHRPDQQTKTSEAVPMIVDVDSLVLKDACLVLE